MASDPNTGNAHANDPRAERLKLLAAARQLHQREGVAGFNTEAVAKEAGSTPEAVSAHFQNAQEILVSLAAEDLTSLARTMQPAETKDTPAKADAVQAATKPPAATGAPPQAPANVRKKPVLSAPLEQVMKDVAPDAGKEVITGAVARLERRMQVLEKAFSEVIDRHEKSVRERGGAVTAVEERIGAMLTRMEAMDKTNADRMVELRIAVSQATTRLDALEMSKAAPRAESDVLAPSSPVAVPPPPVNAVPSAITAPAPQPVPEVKVPAVSEAALVPPLSQLIPEPKDKPLSPAPDAKPSRKDSYLSDARRAALAAAENESVRATLGDKTARKGSRSRFLFFACLAPVVIIGTAVLVLNRHVVTAEPVQVAEATLPLEGPTTGDGGSEPPESVAISPAKSRDGVEPSEAPATATVVAASETPDFHSAEPLANVTRAAEAGDAGAMRDAGLKYLAGDGVETNPSEAARWLMRASYKGEPVAEYWLATLYASGRGVPADAFQAIHWYEASAKQGNRQAMHGLAVASFQGVGVAKNPEQAARWFKQAAELGLGDSQFNLGLLYEEGSGVPRSLTEAYKWYAVVAARGDKQAETRLAALASKMKPEELKEAQAAAASFKPLPINDTANLGGGPVKSGG